MNILAIAGSLREASISGQLADAARKAVERTDHFVNFEILDWSDVPLFNEDNEFPPPDAVFRVREAIQEADGLWIFTPEYNHSIPGPLKNLLDWLSRPLSADWSPVLLHKPVAISGASIATTGTSHAQDQLLLLLNFLDADVMNVPRLVIGNAANQMEDGVLRLSDSLPYLDWQAQAFVDYLRAPEVPSCEGPEFQNTLGLA